MRFTRATNFSDNKIPSSSPVAYLRHLLLRPYEDRYVVPGLDRETSDALAKVSGRGHHGDPPWPTIRVGTKGCRVGQRQRAQKHAKEGLHFVG